MRAGLKIILIVLGAVLITGGSIALTSLTGSGQPVFAPTGISSESESESGSRLIIAPASELSLPSSAVSSSIPSSAPESSKASSKTSSKKSSSKASASSSKASGVTTSISSVPSAPSTVSTMTKEERWASKMAILNDWDQFQKMLADPNNDFWDDDEFWESGEQAYTIPEPPSSRTSSVTSVPSYSDSERLKVMQTDKVTTRNGSTLTTDTYYNTVLRIIGVELSPSYSDECIKAQMVASYTFLRYHAGYTTVPPTAALKDLSDMKAYWKDAGMQRLYKLLEEVGGYMLFIDNHPILSTYGAINNGMTNNIVDVWGGSGKDGYGTPYTYLAGGIDCSKWDVKAKGYASEIMLSSSVVKQQLEDYFGFTLGSDPSKWLVVTKTNSFGYVMTVSVDGKAAITGKDLRGFVFTSARVGVKNSLRSTSFTVEYDAPADMFYFKVKGYGHGVGMSQEGAQQMALAGYKWQDIVKFYFPGVTIV